MKVLSEKAGWKSVDLSSTRSEVRVCVDCTFQREGEEPESFSFPVQSQWKLFPNKEAFLLVDTVSGLVVKLEDKPHYGLKLTMFSLHNSGDCLNDNDSVLSERFETLSEAIKAMCNIVGYLERTDRIG